MTYEYQVSRDGGKTWRVVSVGLSRFDVDQINIKRAGRARPPAVTSTSGTYSWRFIAELA
jgi:hypothetical protein